MAVAVVNQSTARVNYLAVHGLVVGHTAIFTAQNLQVKQLKYNNKERTSENCPDNAAADEIKITHENTPVSGNEGSGVEQG